MGSRLERPRHRSRPGHFADDVVFTSPVAKQLLADSDGVVRGKAALHAYWNEGVRRIPDLRFEVLAVYVGIDTLVINYRNQRRGLVSEVLTFDGDLVREGHGTYLDGPTYLDEPTYLDARSAAGGTARPARACSVPS